jgi:hypothetical protein
MSKASDVRRRRQLIRRIGKTRVIRQFIVGVVAAPKEVFIHRRRLLPVVIKRDQVDYDGKLDERLALEGFVKQGEYPVWFNPKATLDDVVRMCEMKIVGAPQLNFMGIRVTPKTVMRIQDQSR